MPLNWENITAKIQEAASPKKSMQEIIKKQVK